MWCCGVDDAANFMIISWLNAKGWMILLYGKNNFQSLHTSTRRRRKGMKIMQYFYARVQLQCQDFAFYKYFFSLSCWHSKFAIVHLQLCRCGFQIDYFYYHEYTTCARERKKSIRNNISIFNFYCCVAF